jgi:hypothetical protein
MRKLITLVSGSLLLLGIQVANAEQPNFMASLYGDGKVWGTKGATSLPAPNHDKFYRLNSVSGCIRPLQFLCATEGNGHCLVGHSSRETNII